MTELFNIVGILVKDTIAYYFFYVIQDKIQKLAPSSTNSEKATQWWYSMETSEQRHFGQFVNGMHLDLEGLQALAAVAGKILKARLSTCSPKLQTMDVSTSTFTTGMEKPP